MLSTYDHGVDLNLYRATPVGTLDLGICSLIQRTILLSCLYWQRNLFLSGSQRDHYLSKHQMTWKFINEQVKLCMFLCFLFGVFRPTRELYTHMETSSLQVKSWNFVYLYSALMAIEQLRFFIVPHHLDTRNLFIMVISEDHKH